MSGEGRDRTDYSSRVPPPRDDLPALFNCEVGVGVNGWCYRHKRMEATCLRDALAAARRDGEALRGALEGFVHQWLDPDLWMASYETLRRHMNEDEARSILNARAALARLPGGQEAARPRPHQAWRCDHRRTSLETCPPCGRYVTPSAVHSGQE